MLDQETEHHIDYKQGNDLVDINTNRFSINKIYLTNKNLDSRNDTKNNAAVIIDTKNNEAQPH